MSGGKSRQEGDPDENKADRHGVHEDLFGIKQLRNFFRPRFIPRTGRADPSEDEKVEDDQDHDQPRQEKSMDGEKAAEGQRPQLRSAPQDPPQRAADPRDGSYQIDPDLGRPIGLLVPRKEIAGETEGK